MAKGPTKEAVGPRDYVRVPVSTFSPPGMGSYWLYAVSVVDHPKAVKIGRTGSWARRKKSYRNWNLRCGDGILAERAFLIAEEYVDILALEAELILRCRAEMEIYRGQEWFHGSVDGASEVIQRLLFDADYAWDVYD